MKIEITEIELVQILYGTTEYRYDCFIDDVLMDSVVYYEPQDTYKMYEFFIRMIIREWNEKYRKKNNTNAPVKNTIKRLNPKTIVYEEIQNLDLTLKQARTFVRLQKMEGDFE